MVGSLRMQLSNRVRNSQQGQSILLLAFGFIALAAFVGLVTDVSIMFVRFSSLRQAVDSAAVAAAGQIREGTDYGTVALTARQYIRLHGLDPTRVWVETCETDIVEWKEDNPGLQPFTVTPAGETVTVMPETDLCDWDDPRKLVRVTAQIDSQTTFLKLIGIDDFVLTSSSTSETAVVDVALVMDTSMSMARYTTEVDYTAVSLDMPSNVDDPTTYNAPGTIRYPCVKDTYLGYVASNYGYGGCCNDPGSGTALALQPDGSWTIYTDSNGNEQLDTGEAGISNHTADDHYIDLICDPFKQVKDAARNFILRLDFVRGDRVALVTFDFWGNIIFPNDDITQPPMMVSEIDAVNTLDHYVGVVVNPIGFSLDLCKAEIDSKSAAVAHINTFPTHVTGPEQITEFQTQNIPRYRAYETTAPCANTNIGDGILQANNALTNADTIRRDAVWVAILLTDGAANASLPAISRTDSQPGGIVQDYRDAGFCPWSTFCQPNTLRPDELGGDGSTPTVPPQLNTIGTSVLCWLPGDCYYSDNYPAAPGQSNYPLYGECLAVRSHTFVTADVLCNDNIPNSRHFCLDWINNRDPDEPLPAEMNGPDCEAGGQYDADDYAKDMADFAGLIDVAPGIPGNFIAIFTIGFGDEVAASATASSLLRYIADAGDNGVIDNNMQQDWREHKNFLRYGENGTLNGGWPASYGDQDPCYGVTDPLEWCGQYFFAQTLTDLEAVFEAIASRLFTRISR